jgi:CHAD domain-containing protein
MSSQDFLLPEQMNIEGARRALVAALDARSGPLRKGDRTFYDTFDGRLYAAGLSLVYEHQELILVGLDSGAIRARLRAPVPERPLSAGDLEAGALRDAIAPIIDSRVLMPLVQLEIAERGLAMLDGEGKTVVRASLSQSVVLDRAAGRPALPARLALTAVRGYDDDLLRVRRVLERELGFTPAAQPLVAEAIRAAGGRPGGVSSRVDAPLRYEDRADTAVIAVLKRLLEVIEANLDGTIADLDPEFLHDLRVSVRRSRSVQDELRGVFPPAELAHYRAEFRWLVQITGQARDLDVHVLDFDEYRRLLPEAKYADLDPLLEVLRLRRRDVRDQMVLGLTSERAGSLLSRWSAFLSALEAMPGDARPDAARPVGELTGQRIRKGYERLLSMGGAIDEASPAELYHDIRKKGKQLRYMLELFAGQLYPGHVVTQMLRALRGIQDTLGRHQDRELQAAMLTGLSDEVARMPNGARALMAMGVLVDRLGEDALLARREFAERFATFASKRQRQLLEQTFG